MAGWMRRRGSSISIEEAQRLILARVERLPAETVPIDEAGGRVLAERGPRRGRPAALRQLGDGRLRAARRRQPGPAAGLVSDRGRQPALRGRSSRERRWGSPTGGVVPAGADAVIPFEYVVENDNTIELSEAVARGREHPPCRRRCAPRRGGGRRRRPPRACAARRARGGGRRRGARCAEAAGRRARHGQRASPAGRAARAWTDLRGERVAARRAAGVGRRRGRAAELGGRRRGRAPRGALARARGRRARHLRRRLGRAARSRAHGRGRARRRGGLLGSRDEARKADLVRRAGRAARLRAPREPGLGARRVRALRPAGAARSPGRSRPAPAFRARPPCPRRSSRTRIGTSSSARGSSRTETGPCSTRCPGASRT